MSDQPTAAVPQTPARKKKRGLYFYLKVLVVFILLISISMVIAVFYAYNQLAKDGRLEQLIMQKASSATNMHVQFSGYEMSFPGIAIKNLSVATSSAELKLDAMIGDIKIRPDLWAALRGEFMLDTLSLASVSARVVLPYIPSDGADQALDPHGKTAFDPASIRIPFNNFAIDNLRLTLIHGEEQTERQINLKSAYLNRSILSSSMPFSLNGAVESIAEVEASGRLLWPGNLVADIRVGATDLSEIKKLVPEAYLQQAEFFKSGELKVSLKYSFAKGKLDVESVHLAIEPGIRADASVTFASMLPLNASATIRVKPVELAVFMPLVQGFIPEDIGLSIQGGKAGFSADISLVDSQPQDIRATITTEKVNFSLAALPSPVEVAHGKVSWENGKFAFSEFSASVFGSSLQLGKGNLETDPVKFQGDIKADADLAEIFKFASPFLGEEAKTIDPSGRLSFAGKVSYDDKGPVISGSVNSDGLKVREKTTGASAALEKVKLQLADLTSTRGSIKIESLILSGAGAAVSLKGEVMNAVDIGFNLVAEGNLDINEFSQIAAPVFKLPVGKDQFKGRITLSMKLGGSVSDPKPSGKLDLHGVSADLQQNGLMVTNLEGSANADVDKLVVDGLQAELLGGKLKISGSLNNFKKPVIDANAAITGADLAKIRNLIKKNVPDMPPEIEFSGATDLTVALTGDIAEPKLKGNALLKTVRFFHPAVMRPVENINGPITFNNDGLVADRVAADWGKSRAKVSGELKDWSKFISNFKYEVNPLDVTDAAGFFLKDTGYVVSGSGTGSGAITGPIEKIKVSGTALVPSGRAIAPVTEKGEVFRFPFSNLNAKFEYFNQVFALNSADLEVFRGKISGSGKVYLAEEPLKFDFTSKVTEVMTEDFLKENTRFAGALTGGVSGSFNGAGNTSGLVSLNGDAGLVMARGTYNSPPFLKQISERLNEPKLASGTINNLAGNYRIVGGRISSNDVIGTSPHGKMTFKGSIGLDATLDGESRLHIARQVCQSNNVLRELVGSAEFLEVPVTLKGSMLAPSIGLPIDRMIKEAAERRGKEAVKKEAGKLLDRVLGGGKSSPPTNQAQPATASEKKPQPKVPPAKQIEKKVKDLGNELKNLFRRK